MAPLRRRNHHPQGFPIAAGAASLSPWLPLTQLVEQPIWHLSPWLLSPQLVSGAFLLVFLFCRV